MSDTPQVIKANNIKWSKNAVLTMTSLDGASASPLSGYVLERTNYSGDTVDLVEVNDISDNKMSKDYVIGMDDGGQLTVAVTGIPSEIPIRSRWTITLTIDGVTVISARTGIVTNARSVEASAGRPAATTLQFKILPNNSRLAAAAVVAEPTVSTP